MAAGHARMARPTPERYPAYPVNFARENMHTQHQGGVFQTTMLAISRHKSPTSLRQQPLGNVPYLSAICAVFHKQRPPPRCDPSGASEPVDCFGGRTGGTQPTARSLNWRVRPGRVRRAHRTHKRIQVPPRSAWVWHRAACRTRSRTVSKFVMALTDQPGLRFEHQRELTHLLVGFPLFS